MKILYGIQGTGNGHIARAKELIPELDKIAEVDALISGAHHDLSVPFNVKYNFNGMGFYFGKNGSIDYLKSFKQFNALKFWSDLRSVDVKNYDLVVSDFEPVSAWAAKLGMVPSLALSHQSAMLSPRTPKPKSKEIFGELILHYYAPTQSKIAFHFDSYDAFIHTPVIRKDIRSATVTNNGHITVYLPAYSDERIIEVLSQIEDKVWEVFSKHSHHAYEAGNVKIRKINGDDFCKSLASCEGVICGAGFETPAEAMYMHKKLLTVPMAGQYEQKCNAAALERLGVPVLSDFCPKQVEAIRKWVDNPQSYQKINYPDNARSIAQKVLET